mmetsp:Transcript_4823/g.9666  ORF Transcript_4823/g.9666 Transcript_4823/m.9666 type:complete len:144 (-) Transcript_4823:239-670(-)
MFGLVIPGRPQTDLLQDPQNSYRWGVEVNTPASIGEFLVFLKTPMQIPNAGVGVYFSFPPFADYEFLGALDDSKPSDLFSTGWSLRPEVESCPAVRVCAMVEPAAELLEKLKTNPPKDVKLQYARCTALNLFRFIESFSQVSK